MTEARAQARVIVDHANQGADLAFQTWSPAGPEEYDRLVKAPGRDRRGGSTSRDELIGRPRHARGVRRRAGARSRVDVDQHRALIDEAIASGAATATGGGAG